MRLNFLTAGESHGPALVTILEGLPAGLPVPVEVVNSALARRQQGPGSGPRMKLEKDRARLLAGVMSGETTGAPIAILIENKDHTHWQGRNVPAFTIPRPGHADLTGAIKYGYRDLRPSLERASARETAARVAVGAICQLFLRQFNILVGGYVSSIGEVAAELAGISLLDRPGRASASPVYCPDLAASKRMEDRIRQVMQAGDTLGGVIEIVAWGVPPGLGSFAHWEHRLDARLGAAVLSIPGIKGVEVGTAFENTLHPGSHVQDPINIEGDRLIRPTNYSGGLEGGVTTGQPIILRAAMKAIASTLTPQPSVDLATGKPTQTQYVRSDFCPVPRAIPVMEAMLAFVLADALLDKLGGDSMDEIRPRFKALRQPILGDLKMDGGDLVYWQEEHNAVNTAGEENVGENNAG